MPYRKIPNFKLKVSKPQRRKPCGFFVYKVLKCFESSRDACKRRRRRLARFRQRLNNVRHAFETQGVFLPRKRQQRCQKATAVHEALQFNFKLKVSKPQRRKPCGFFVYKVLKCFESSRDACKRRRRRLARFRQRLNNVRHGFENQWVFA